MLYGYMDVMLAMKMHLMKGYLHHNVCGFNSKMDQLDHFHAKRCILEDLVHSVG